MHMVRNITILEKDNDMLIRTLVRFFPESESEVQIYNVATGDITAAIDTVRGYLDIVKQTYSQLEVEMVEEAKYVQVMKGLFKVQ